ncbi:hypothetical protein SAMN05444920_102954 [Nonomuraea solani]|uniref:Uncharacterized protein n=1 Tax=Nonomuraea solani TaxID=1144553 RepID=A0A1H6A0N9_9ACTN|nr:hypothetical protein SAMN05444920_102954 [Nonomuraea solani]
MPNLPTVAQPVLPVARGNLPAVTSAVPPGQPPSVCPMMPAQPACQRSPDDARPACQPPPTGLPMALGQPANTTRPASGHRRLRQRRPPGQRAPEHSALDTRQPTTATEPLPPTATGPLPPRAFSQRHPSGQGTRETPPMPMATDALPPAFADGTRPADHFCWASHGARPHINANRPVSGHLGRSAQDTRRPAHRRQPGPPASGHRAFPSTTRGRPPAAPDWATHGLDRPTSAT